jgi:hypothetical protein
VFKRRRKNIFWMVGVQKEIVNNLNFYSVDIYTIIGANTYIYIYIYCKSANMIGVMTIL